MFSAKHYLCCVALVLCVGSSAYANKNPAARGLMQKFKAGIASQLPSDGKLAHKLANSKLGRTAVAGLLGITLACGGTGCGNGDGLITPTETEMVEVAVQVVDRYDGDSIYFELRGTVYEGLVIEGVSADEVLVEVAGSSDMVININDIGGTLLADHPDVGVKVKILGDRAQGEKMLTGKITAGYNDDVRKIEIHAIKFIDGRFERLDDRRIRFVHEDTDFEDGGYLTLEEFADLIRNGN